MKVKKGIIAAGGWSTRFLPAVKTYAQPLIPVLDRACIQYLVEEMVGAGIEEVAVIHRHGEGSIKKYFSPDKELEEYLKKTKKGEEMKNWKKVMGKVKKWRFIPQSRKLPYGNATPILTAKNFIDDKPFVYMFGDDFVIEKKRGKYLGRMIEIFEKERALVVLGAQEVPKKEIKKYGAVKYVKEGGVKNQVAGIIEKPPVRKTPSRVAQFGRFVISPAIFEVLDKQGVGEKGELWLTDANNSLAQTGVVIAEPIEEGLWMTTGDPLNWLKTNILMGLRDKKIGKELRSFVEKLDKWE